MPYRPGARRQPWRSPRTPIPGLTLTGADALFLGVTGAAMAGVAAAASIAGPLLLARLARAAAVLGPAAVPEEPPAAHAA